VGTIFVVEGSADARLAPLLERVEESGEGIVGSSTESELEVEVRAFEDQEGVLAACLASPPDLLVARDTPPGAGVELCRRLRANHDRLALPVILVSERDGLDDVSVGYEAGADEYLIDPVEAKDLRRRARFLLARRARSQERKAGPAGTGRRYELVEELGKGRMGTVWRARRRKDAAELALKLLPAGAPRASVQRLLGEAQLLRSLAEVPGIVRVRDVGSDAGSAYYAMDLVPGRTLRTLLDASGRLPSPDVARIVRSLALTLEALSAAGYVHGDVKPGNILLGPGGPVLIDFGLAHRIGTPAAERGGTLAYLAPEVVQGQLGTATSDVYSLGVILFEALTGGLPFPNHGTDLAAFKAEAGPHLLDLLLEQDLPPGAVALIESTLHSDPALRTASAAEVALALLPYAGRQVESPSPA
jgi:DNA-binding response OmpR family regulator